MKKSTIRAIIKDPNRPAREETIPNTLDTLQRLVGGYIETVTPASDWLIICNEEGRLEGLPYNVEVCGIDFVGPIVLAGMKGDELTDFPCSMEQLRKVIPELFEEE